MVATDAVWAVGTNGYIFRWNGSAWGRDTSPPSIALYALSMVSATDGWPWAAAETLSTSTVPPGATTPAQRRPPSAVHMVNANEGWAGGTSGLMLHYQNGTWTQIMPNPAAYTIEGIDMLNANKGWAVGYNGTILHYLNGTWSGQTSPVTVNLLNVHMLNNSEGWAVGQNGTLLHYLNGTWTQIANPTGHNLRDVHMLSATDGWAVSECPAPSCITSRAPAARPRPAPAPPVLARPARPPRPAQPPRRPPARPPGRVPPSRPAHLSPQAPPSPQALLSPPAPPAPRRRRAHRAARPPSLPRRRRPARSSSPMWTRTTRSTPSSAAWPAAGIVSGYADGTFRWGNDVTRGQLAKIIAGAAGLSDADPHHPADVRRRAHQQPLLAVHRAAGAARARSAATPAAGRASRATPPATGPTSAGAPTPPAARSPRSTAVAAG